MLNPNDDIFACGVVEPQSATLCSVVLIDDLIILGIIAAVTVASSQIAASENESNSNALLDKQQREQAKQTQLGWLQQRGHDAMAGVASRNGGHGGASQTDILAPVGQMQAIQNHYDLGRDANARQADATRTQGYIQAGSAVASGIAGQALKAPSSGGGGGLVDTFGSTGQDIASRAAQYDLPSTGSVVATPQLQPTDPNGGFQLQASDYATLGGAGPYSASPFADDPYATAPQYQNPNRYRFGF